MATSHKSQCNALAALYEKNQFVAIQAALHLGFRIPLEDAVWCRPANDDRGDFLAVEDEDSNPCNYPVKTASQREILDLAKRIARDNGGEICEPFIDNPDLIGRYKSILKSCGVNESKVVTEAISTKDGITADLAEFKFAFHLSTSEVGRFAREDIFETHIVARRMSAKSRREVLRKVEIQGDRQKSALELIKKHLALTEKQRKQRLASRFGSVPATEAVADFIVAAFDL